MNGLTINAERHLRVPSGQVSDPRARGLDCPKDSSEHARRPATEPVSPSSFTTSVFASITAAVAGNAVYVTSLNSGLSLPNWFILRTLSRLFVR